MATYRAARGCLDAARELLRDDGIGCVLREERCFGDPLDVAFVGTLRPDREAATCAMLKHEAGVLCAPTAFGKTVTAAAPIATHHLCAVQADSVHSRKNGQCPALS